MIRSLLLTLLCFLCLVTAGRAQSVGEAYSRYEANDFEASAKLYDKALRKGTGSSTDYYNAACSWALAGNKKKAFGYLNAAIEKGFMNVSHLKQDSDLSSLRTGKRWPALVRKLEENVARIEANYNQPLKARLELVFEQDQKYRRMIDSVQANYGMASEQWKMLESRMNKADAANLKEVTCILDEYGWPGKTLVGPKATLAVFLVVQHADLKIQEKYVPLMRAAAEKGEVSKANLALLEDRILAGNGKPQLYGSQVRLNPETQRYELHPILDEPHVDNRRAEMGLPPLKDYLKRFGISYALPPLDRGPHNE
ncbi:DUF6624 domain-containing protein [Pontibacter liquoris]|uniref:DUF6624 domain-containing protein n=1 Tax=Pontibacter liquoris TaxID=2905677 RepID=UPI001FA6DE66|nr:DUF6624 domain-containing protein [Pontibacter liquoris]